MGKVKNVLKKIHTACKRLKVSDNENWRTTWKKGRGRNFGYDHDRPLVFMESPDGSVSLTLSKNPYTNKGYIWEFNMRDENDRDNFITNETSTIDEALDQMSNDETVTSFFSAIAIPEDMIKYINTNTSNNQQLEAVESLVVEKVVEDVNEEIVETVNETINGAEVETSAKNMVKDSLNQINTTTYSRLF